MSPFWIVFVLSIVSGVPLPVNQLIECTFETRILNQSDPLCNGSSQRCIVYELFEPIVRRETLYDGTSLATGSQSTTTSSNNNDNQKNDDDDAVEAINAYVRPTVYLGAFDLPKIINQVIRVLYPNETFNMLTSNNNDRRGTDTPIDGSVRTRRGTDTPIDGSVRTRRGTDTTINWDWSSQTNCVTTGNSTHLTTTCSSSGNVNPTRSISKCFSSDSWTYIKIGDYYRKIPMANLQMYYGHSMLGYNENITDTTLMTLVHMHPSESTFFRKIILETTYLTVTPNHLVYKYDDSKGQLIEEYVSELHVGDILYVLNPSTRMIFSEKIQSIDEIVQNGFYSPMPKDGIDFFVNNVLVSPFSSYKGSTIHTFHYMYAYLVSFTNHKN